jgi:hypothetical protein
MREKSALIAERSILKTITMCPALCKARGINRIKPILGLYMMGHGGQ